MLKQLSDSRGLGPTEVSRRARIVVETAVLPEAHLRELAKSLADLSAVVRQAVTSALPPPLRRLVYSSQSPNSEAERPAPTQPPAPRPSETRTTAESGGLAEPRHSSSVILLGTFADHEENLLTLDRKGFAPLRATTVDQLEEYLDHEVCGVVVARSWWTGIPEPDREGVLQRIVAHSSFTWLKIDSHELPGGAERLNSLLLETRHAMPTIGECVCHDGWRITPHDMAALERIRALLTDAEAVRLCPADIQETQARVLIGAAIKHVSQRNGSGTFRINRVDANFIHGGRSAAKIIRMAPDDDGAPLVAKIDDVEHLRDEMKRFRRYAQRWDEALSPQLHYHAGTSLIVFGLVESPDQPGRPAPTLEETLESMFYGEHWPGEYRGPSEADLRQLVIRAIRKLQRLNRQVNDGGCKPKTHVLFEPYETLRGNGVNWKIGHSDGSDGSVFEFVEAARSRIAALGDQVIVHGDVQLRNILVRDGREPHFIDYANCGPGHPCFDLARLESAILFYCGRMNGDERELGTVLFDILAGRPEAEIARRHPLFCTSRTNRLAIHACCACRTAAIETLATLAGNEDDWLAMKYVIACQSLFTINMQSGVVRAQLAALGSYLRTRSGW
ncbi:MAG: phosphotransferase [Isosphaeraceae bacterium]